MQQESGTKNIRNSRSGRFGPWISAHRRHVFSRCQIQHDKIKRKALLAPNTTNHDSVGGPPNHPNEDQQAKVMGRTFGTNLGNTIDLGAVVGGMEVNRVRDYTLTAQGSAYLGTSSDSENTDCQSHFGRSLLATTGIRQRMGTTRTGHGPGSRKSPIPSQTFPRAYRTFVPVRKHVRPIGKRKRSRELAHGRERNGEPFWLG